MIFGELKWKVNKEWKQTVVGADCQVKAINYSIEVEKL